MTNIQNATFTSVWDDFTEIDSACKVNMNTREVFDIEKVNVDDYDIDVCTEQFITMPDGNEFSVYCTDSFDIDELADDEYWYDV